MRKAGYWNTATGDRQEMKIQVLYRQIVAMDISIWSSQKNPVRVQDCNDSGLISQRTTQDMLQFMPKAPQMQELRGKVQEVMTVRKLFNPMLS